MPASRCHSASAVSASAVASDSLLPQVVGSVAATACTAWLLADSAKRSTGVVGEEPLLRQSRSHASLAIRTVSKASGGGETFFEGKSAQRALRSASQVVHAALARASVTLQTRKTAGFEPRSRRRSYEKLATFAGPTTLASRIARTGEVSPVGTLSRKSMNDCGLKEPSFLCSHTERAHARGYRCANTAVIAVVLRTAADRSAHTRWLFATFAKRSAERITFSPRASQPRTSARMRSHCEALSYRSFGCEEGTARCLSVLGTDAAAFDEGSSDAATRIPYFLKTWSERLFKKYCVLLVAVLCGPTCTMRRPPVPLTMCMKAIQNNKRKTALRTIVAQSRGSRKRQIEWRAERERRGAVYLIGRQPTLPNGATAVRDEP